VNDERARTRFQCRVSVRERNDEKEDKTKPKRIFMREEAKLQTEEVNVHVAQNDIHGPAPQKEEKVVYDHRTMTRTWPRANARTSIPFPFQGFCSSMINMGW
jgi:hypothetical protein